MKTPALVVAAMLLAPVAGEGLAAESAAEPTVPTARIDLFNGKDFSGWTFCMRDNAEPSKTWSVSNGVLHCTGRPNGYARTAQSYRDYKLTVEWRYVKVAPQADNTGIFVHVQPPDRVWPKCIECQGQYGHQGDLILVGGAAFKGQEPAATFRIVRSAEPANEKPVGEWNTYEIVCAGDTLKVSVNGKLMNEAAGCSVAAGAIAIQSEGGDFEVRKVFLEPVR